MQLILSKTAEHTYVNALLKSKLAAQLSFATVLMLTARALDESSIAGHGALGPQQRISVP